MGKIQQHSLITSTSILGVLLLSALPVRIGAAEIEPVQRNLSGSVLDPSVWRTPPIRPQGFQFEIQITSLGSSYKRDLVRQSILGHNLGEYESVVSKVIAAEWGYSFTHLDGKPDGAGRTIQAGYPTPPTKRADCLPVIEAFLQRQYIRGKDRPWASMNGHFPWHHYAAEFGFDQIGSEIGENINNYQWHIALTRGAARQYSRPWFVDFSAWHGPSITDYSEGRIWGDYSGPDHGHSISLFERSLFMSYMAGAGQITAEAGGAISFLPELDEKGRYRLSPYGNVCKKFRDFTLSHPDVGIPCTPFGIVLDYYHGAYPGFGKRQAFGYFDYTVGDKMTWDLINLVWPGGWQVMGKNEAGTMVNGPVGDTVDVLLQNASQRVLNSYACLILSGDVRLSAAEIARYTGYVRQGGTLILNTAYLGYFPEYAKGTPTSNPSELTDGKGRVIVYGPDFQLERLGPILQGELARLLPVTVSPGVQYLVNVKPGSLYVTLINNNGVTKAPKAKPVVDASKVATLSVSYKGGAIVGSVRDILRDRTLPMKDRGEISLTLPPGQVEIVEFSLK